MTQSSASPPMKKSYWNTLRFNLLTWFLAVSILPLLISSFLFYNILISIVITIIAVVVIYFFVTKRLTAPIVALAKANDKPCQTKAHIATSEQYSNEINQLIYSFNNMLELQHSHEQQKQLNTEITPAINTTTKNNILKQADAVVTNIPTRSINSSKNKKLIPLQTYTWPKEARLLIVEDNRINQQVALGILKEFNLTADIAANGLEAIIALENATQTKPYTLILMDCKMPEMDGYEATRNIRSGKADQKNINIPIIAMTANVENEDREKCINAGMSDYISKPINPEQLINKIQYWLVEHDNVKGFDVISQDIESSTNETSLPLESFSDTNENEHSSDKIEWDIETALNRVRGNKKLLVKLVCLYLEDIPEHIEVLKKSILDKDIKILKLTAHSIRGASGNLYAYRMQDLAKSIETYLIENTELINFDELTLMASPLDKEFALLQDTLHSFLKSN